ncbi:MAG: zinc ribbon domain-containing protein [Candidatus Omnitrophica bacterium]|jgi:uncharacterized OB-fold protein/predicted nucleic acid-binding Zn ribbon protein|nr:zinc ribbon domain-containing protein [Candidatus Omnitrophota bacterium]MDD5660538.1 zinc ribbon domain-containing protein [Candidatus Omnitrophota bacterium]
MKKRKKVRFKFNFNKKKDKHRNQIKPAKRDISNYSYKIGNRIYKLSVERVEVINKTDMTGSIYYYRCAFCNKDFGPDIQTCPGCGRELTKVNLKKCQLCGAKNSPNKQNCWVCNGPFPKLEEKIEKQSQVLLTLNVNNNFYRNTDRVLGLGMRKLFDDLIATNFNKEPLEAWAKLHEGEAEFKKEFAREECRNIVKESKKRSFLYWVAFILPVIILLMLVAVFWSK